MQLELMFTDQKWNILRSLSEQPQSPLQLSQKLNTTMANISQQLKLLEAVNLVKKEKIRNRDKGKPRTLFSLNGEYAFLIPVTRHFAEKKLLHTTAHQKAILRIWFLEQHQHDIERFYWQLHDSLKDIQALVVNQTTNKVYIVSDSRDVVKDVKGKNFSVEYSSPKEFSSVLTKLHGHKLAFIHGHMEVKK
jgi:predicted transcriptional regulator